MFKLFYIIIFGVGLLALSYGFTQSETGGATTEIEWLTWEEAMALARDGDKKVLVDVYTNYCSWCRKMEAQTFKDPAIVSYINDNFYPVKFDAEHAEPITFKGKEYKFIPNKKEGRDKGYHELVLWMTNGKIQGYPTMVFIDEQQEVIQSIPGYLPPEKFEPIMTWFGGNHYKKTPWGIYLKKHQGDKSKGTRTTSEG